VALLVFVSSLATVTLLAAVLLGDVRDRLFLAVLLALFQTVFYGLPVAAVVYYVLRRRRGRRRADASRDDTYGDARFAPLTAEFAEPDAAAACLVYRPEGKRTEVGYVPASARDLRVARWSWDQLSRHVLVVGATGSGKTSTVFSHLMLSARVPWVYQDQKAERPSFRCATSFRTGPCGASTRAATGRARRSGTRSTKCVPPRTWRSWPRCSSRTAAT